MPLTPQAAFTLQSGESVFRPPEAGGFVRFCLPDPLPVSMAPFRVPVASRDLPARSSRQSHLDVLVSVAATTYQVTEFIARTETSVLGAVTRIAVGLYALG